MPQEQSIGDSVKRHGIRRGSIMVPSPPGVSHRVEQQSHPPVPSSIYADSSPQGKGMAIPGATTYSVPPPLPPVRYNHDLDVGVDIAWSLQNEGFIHSHSGLAPIKPGSSLLGSFMRAQPFKDDDYDVDMDLEIDGMVHDKTMPSRPVRDQLVLMTAHPYATASNHTQSTLSPRLHGDQPLSRENHYRSTNAYDQHLVQKIGKSVTAQTGESSIHKHRIVPPPHLHIATRESGIPSILAKTSAVSARSMPPLPSNVLNLRDSQANLREQAIFSSPISDLPIGSPLQNDSHRPDRGEQCYDDRLGHSRTQNTAPRYVIGRQLNLAKELPQYPDAARPSLRLGTKRRALSPGPEIMFHDDRRSSQASSVSTEPSKCCSDTTHRQQRTDSVSSTTSSAFPQSIASSYWISATSSLTSASTLDSVSVRTPAEFAAPDLTYRLAVPDAKTITPQRKLSDTSSNAEVISRTVSSTTDPRTMRIGQYFICSCCPKKPRRFDNEEQLSHHENEKQFACAFCKHRFKNKNEAERHQNSLHLRKQSWSCAALSTYEAAFHVSADVEASGVLHDTCGFCGVEFSNNAKNWNERIDHLIEVHKFGECNATKKFFRADHFRQHLKHSHAGKSGKWTNILENSCQREEAISEPLELS